MNAFPSNARLSRQTGVIAILFAVVIIVIIAFMGLAIDTARAFNRRVELSRFANVAALAAAKHLDGTPDGIDRAISAASLAVADAKYAYGNSSIVWDDAYLTFSGSTSGSDWKGAANAKLTAGGAQYVKVDTSAGSGDIGSVTTTFMRLVSPSRATMSTRAQAVAGRSEINVTPLAVCAMSPPPAAKRLPGDELVEYGFRRGVGYDLMQLNPNSGTPANFVINPIDPADKQADAKAGNVSAAVVGPFVCSGKMPMRRLSGNDVLVSSTIPLGSLFQQLNSRFDQYTGGQCQFKSAPPDANIRQYTYNTSSVVNWMKVAPTTQTATSAPVGDGRGTIADLPATPSADPALLGPLWSYAKPVPFAQYSEKSPEPAAGYKPFEVAELPSLYASALPETNANYPDSVPYDAKGGSHYSAPATIRGKGVRNRRVLHIPLLKCPIDDGANTKAEVLAIGRFFMTVPATSSSIRAEFAGIADESALGGAVELY